MKAIWVIPVALAIGLVVASDSAAQFGRPSFVPRFSPPPRFTPPPRFVPHVPVTPHPNPGVPRTPTIAERQRNNAFSHATPSRAAVLATATVGLLASPMGQGALLETCTLAAEQTHPRNALADPGLLGLNQKVGLNGKIEWEIDKSKIPDVLRKQHNAPAPPSENSGWFWALAVLGIAGLVFAIARTLGDRWATTAARARVRIVSTPPGEAPQGIREAWIGLELPVVSGQSKQGVFGVLSQHMAGSCDGYAVNGAEAVKLLAAKDSEAAAWWRSNAPHVLSNDYQLVFPAEVCDAVG